jgi:hypothetical protein
MKFEAILFLAACSILSKAFRIVSIPPRFMSNAIKMQNEEIFVPITSQEKFSRQGKVASAAAVSLLNLLLLKGVKAEEKAYLTDPTDDFKAEQIKTAEYNAKQKKIRKDWDILINQFQESKDPAKTADTLKQMRLFLVSNGSIPTGVKKLDVVKMCRKKKFLKGRQMNPELWSKDAEIEYEAFIQEFNKKVSPDNKVCVSI